MASLPANFTLAAHPVMHTPPHNSPVHLSPFHDTAELLPRPSSRHLLTTMTAFHMPGGHEDALPTTPLIGLPLAPPPPPSQGLHHLSHSSSSLSATAAAAAAAAASGIFAPLNARFRQVF